MLNCIKCCSCDLQVQLAYVPSPYFAALPLLRFCSKYAAVHWRDLLLQVAGRLQKTATQVRSGSLSPGLGFHLEVDVGSHFLPIRLHLVCIQFFRESVLRDLCVREYSRLHCWVYPFYSALSLYWFVFVQCQVAELEVVVSCFIWVTLVHQIFESWTCSCLLRCWSSEGVWVQRLRAEGSSASSLQGELEDSQAGAWRQTVHCPEMCAHRDDTF